MIKLEVFDPPMCCSTGVCSDNADPKLVIFASDLEWLKIKGINVVRHGLSFEPSEFILNAAVNNLLKKEGNSCLPIIVIGDNIMHKGSYPSREKLAQICNVKYDEEKPPFMPTEENCCCGVDCDCHSFKLSTNSSYGDENYCEYSAAEDNCINYNECKMNNTFIAKNFKTILVIFLLLTLIVLIAYKRCCRADAKKSPQLSFSTYSIYKIII